jgi:2-polyprenyl-3-methyl-5-hydroxy-6-metoxy-1,4-benzoquinol methylase
MLTRTLEPEVMAGAQEALDYDAMDHADVNSTFVADILRFAPELLCADASALDLGAGTALIAIELARHTNALRVTARDMSEAMLRQARRNIVAADLASRIQTDRSEARHPDRQRYHLVISNSVVHHIAEPLELLRAALAATRPGGVLFVRDLLRPATEIDLDKMVDHYATPADCLCGETRASALRQRELFRASLRAALTLDEARAAAEAIGVDGAQVNQTSDRHWTLAHRTAF